MSFDKLDIKRNECMLTGKFRKKGYDWWWHSFTGINEITKEKRQFFIEYFIINPALSPNEIHYGQLEESKKNGIKPSYMMIKCGSWGKNKSQLHRFFKLSDVEIGKNPFSVKTIDCLCTDTLIKGSVHISEKDSKDHKEWMCDYGDMEWNLEMEKLIPFNVGYGASTLFRKIKAFEMYWHAQGMKTLFQGNVIYNGEKYIVDKETCNGYQDKNWGSNFTSPWVWISSNNLYSKTLNKKLENSVFDIGGGKPKIYFISLKGKLLSAFYYEGKKFEFNFSKFWTFTRTKFDCKELEDRISWHIEQKTWNNKMITDLECMKEDMLFVNYESPDGMKRYSRLFNGGNGFGTIKLYRKGKLIDEINVVDAGCEYGEYDK